MLEKHFNSLCNNYQLTIDELKTIPQLFTDGDQLSKMMATSSSSDVRKMNEKILTYLIMKLCYNGSSTNLVRLCDVINESFIDSTDTPTCTEQIRCGMYNMCLDLLMSVLYAHTYSTLKVFRIRRVHCISPIIYICTVIQGGHL